MNDITVHSVVRNEPFVYYAIKSIYEGVDTILLYDTGSDDKYTLNDIDRLLDEDVDKKILFKSVPIDVDQSVWTYHRLDEYNEAWKDKFGVGDVRQMQVDDTTTKFFLVVDGDEVHHDDTIKKIKEALPRFEGGIIWGKIPYYNFCDVDKIHGYKRAACRFFMTDKIYVRGVHPYEEHCIKGLGSLSDKPGECMHMYNVLSYAHFEMCMKPWRRNVTQPVIPAARRYIPKVMLDEPYYIERFKEERERRYDASGRHS